MLERQGNIVNISSAIGRLRDRGFVAYGTAKAAMSHMTRLLAADLAPEGAGGTRVAVGGFDGNVGARRRGSRTRPSTTRWCAAPRSVRLGGTRGHRSRRSALPQPRRRRRGSPGKILEVDGGHRSDEPAVPGGLPGTPQIFSLFGDEHVRQYEETAAGVNRPRLERRLCTGFCTPGA